jgi:energy-converting hydrogenase B subunit Q
VTCGPARPGAARFPGDARRLMAWRPAASTAAIRFDVVDGLESASTISAAVAALGGRVRTLATVRSIDGTPPLVEIDLEVEGVNEDELVGALEAIDEVRAIHRTRALGSVFGKRIIVVGGGAQVAQVALGAVSEADRHNLRGERISVDTIPLVGESDIAAAVRAVADLPRARLLVLAGSIMGGDISTAADELRDVGIPIIALNMVGSITEHVDLVVSDPVQAGTMAVMAVAETATFDLERQRGRRY